jgi:hypothetical protein
MNQQFTPIEYADIQYISGFWDGNSRASADEYRGRFPNRQIPKRQVFSDRHQRLRETGALLHVTKNMQHGGPLLCKSILDLVQRIPTISVRRMSIDLVNTHRGYGEPHMTKVIACNVCGSSTGCLRC